MFYEGYKVKGGTLITNNCLNFIISTFFAAITFVLCFIQRLKVEIASVWK
jgi:hypothetical protein